MSEILISEIVTDTADGTAYFDKLMSAIQVRLDDQYTQQRISGDAYASVYLGAMQTALQQSIAFALGREQADKQADLIANQAEEVLASTIRNDLMSTSSIAKDTSQIAKTDADTALTGNQNIEVQASTVRNDALSNSTITKNTADIARNDSLAVSTIAKDNAQKSKIDNETILTSNQSIEILASTVRNDALSASNISKNTTDTARNDLIATSQIDKATSEKALLDQKKFTEEAQILDTVNAVAVAGLVGKQKELYTNQAEGFIRQAEQKAMKAFTDIWTIARSTDDTVPAPNHIDQGSMDALMEKVVAGIGMTPTDITA